MLLNKVVYLIERPKIFTGRVLIKLSDSLPNFNYKIKFTGASNIELELESFYKNGNYYMYWGRLSPQFGGHNIYPKVGDKIIIDENVKLESLHVILETYTSDNPNPHRREIIKDNKVSKYLDFQDNLNDKIEKFLKIKVKDITI